MKYNNSAVSVSMNPHSISRFFNKPTVQQSNLNLKLRLSLVNGPVNCNDIIFKFKNTSFL
jgi:hypothetical protein